MTLRCSPGYQDHNCPITVFLKLWVATQKWVAKAMRMGREGLEIIARKRKKSVRRRFEKRTFWRCHYVFKTKMKKIGIRFEVKTFFFVLENTRFWRRKSRNQRQIRGEDFFFFRDHYVFTTLSQIYLGRGHLCKSLF